MTKAMKSITHEFTNRQKAIVNPCPFTIEEDVTEVLYGDRAYEVIFNVHWRCQAFVKDSSNIERVRQDMLEGVRRELYSDVEGRVIEIQKSLHQMDSDSALEKCFELMRYLREV